MSTKIYHGYRLAEGTDVWDFTERLRREGNEERDRLDMETIESLADEVASKRRAEGREPGATREARLMGGYHAWDAVMRQLEESRLGDPHRLDACFIRDPEGGRVMALLYAGSKMEHVFERQPEVEAWGYWNNTDRPDDVTDEEWEERRETWDRCLGWDPPVRRGLGFQLRASATDGIVEMIYRKAEEA